jgi:PAS domain S-box-containing protein
VAHVDNDRAHRECPSYGRGLTIERLPLAYIEFDHDVRVLEWNPAAERIFGYTRHEALGQNLLDLILPGPPSDQIQVVLDRIWAGDSEAHSINQNLTKHGNVIDCDWFNTPILETNGTISRAISLGRDITVPGFFDARVSNLDRIDSHDLSLLGRLTRRQREVLRLVVEGYRAKEIARKMERSLKTIELHRSCLMDTLDIHDVPGLVRFAIRVGLISVHKRVGAH